MAQPVTKPKPSPKKVSLRPLGYALMPSTYFARESRSWMASIGGWIALVIFGVIAYVHILFIWHAIDFAQGEISGSSLSPLKLLSRIDGQFAILIFSLEFILATRAKWVEKIFGGFDRVYRMHSILGRLGFLLMIMHFAFSIANSSAYWIDYVLPSSEISVLFGQISLALFIILVAVSVWVKLPYHVWLLTHKFMGVAFLFAGMHVWLIQPEYRNFDPYRTIYTIIWYAGVYSFFYKLLFYKYMAPSHRAIVEKIVQRHDVVDLYMKMEGEKFTSRPGDFVFITLTKSRRKLMKEEHPFSISGLYDGNVIRVSIKDLGDFTHTVSNVQAGDEVVVFGPYGKFDDKLYTKKNDMIWIGGGIGIAPFVYMAQYFSTLPGSGKGTRKAHLFHSVRDVHEAMYVEELEEYRKKDKDFSYEIWNSSKNGYLSAQAMADAVGGVDKLKERMVFICGPTAMMHGISKQLIDLGMPPRQIIFEEFAFM